MQSSGLRPRAAAPRFSHPYTPYPCQTALMSALYDTVEHGHVGVFESPTGTGKTLSVICAVFQWLQDFNARRAAEAHSRTGEGVDSGATDARTAASASSSAVETGTHAPAWITDFDEEKRRADARATSRREAELEERVQARMAVVRKQEDEEEATRRRVGSIVAAGAAAGAHVTLHKRSRGGAAAGGDAAREHMESAASKAAQFDDELITGEYASDDDVASSRGRISHTSVLADSLRSERARDEVETQLLRGRAATRQDNDYVLPKVYYASRTHSQIAQFVNEIRRTVFRDMRIVTLGSRKTLCVNPDVKRLRSDIRVNEACRDLLGESRRSRSKKPTSSHDSAAPGAAVSAPADVVSHSASSGCPFYSAAGHAAMAERLLARGRDIEDAVRTGEQLHACAYYGSRDAVQLAHVVAMPYSVLLSETARNSFDVRLRGSIVVIDEAHNILDAINSTHSASVTHQNLTAALQLVRSYLTHYASRMHTSNVVRCTQLVEVIEALLFVPPSLRARSGPPGPHAAIARVAVGDGCMERAAAEGKASSFPAPPPSTLPSGPDDVAGMSFVLPEFLRCSGLDRFNLPSLLSYIDRVDLLRKLRGYGERTQKSHVAGGGKTTSVISGDAEAPPELVACIYSVHSLLSCLARSDPDARIIVSRGPARVPVLADPAGALVASAPSCTASPARRTAASFRADITLKYISLNAHAAFKPIITEARSVLLVGGTMQPFADITRTLFVGTPDSHIRTFTCGHIIPPENLVALAASHGPGGHKFDFRHAARSSRDQMDELGRAITHLAASTPAGMVVFLPSYDYERMLFEHWSVAPTAGACAHLGSVLDILARHKRVFREPSSASEMEKVLRAYTEAVGHTMGDTDKENTPSVPVPPRLHAKGAVLFAVMGGKMSEGINFSDDLARCVVVVGLPYANASDPELSERMRYAERAAKGFSSSGLPAHTAPGTAASGGWEMYENMCMKTVNQSIGRSIRHSHDYAAIVMLDHRFGNPRIQGKLPGWIAARTSAHESWAPLAASLAAFFRSHPGSHANKD